MTVLATEGTPAAALAGMFTALTARWRKTYREGLLPEAKPALLPVTLTPLMVSDQLPAASSSASTDCLTIEFGQVRIRIEGRPDAGVLRLVLAELQQR